MLSVPLSVLDRSRTRVGETEAETLRATVELAQRVEELGYKRFWVSEHHSVPGVVGSAPTVLAAAVAARTDRIRVGTGGVMLPNHKPLVVAEQFGVLESLYPGRIDMGLGRSVGFTNGVRRALGVEKDAADDFTAQVQELLGYLAGTSTDQVHARPGEGLRIPPFVLAVGEGATIAASLGLPVVLAARSDSADLLKEYRSTFRPSAWASEPYVILAVTAAVADSSDAARELLLPEAWASAYSRTRGVFPPLQPDVPEEMTAREQEFFENALRGQIYGTPADVDEALADVVRRTAADELLITTNTYDRAALLATYAALAKLTG
ncbi:LLM class flavin-dependent oxidoreductase [Kribbella sp. VKM Ac-2566]|uniref:LLM class flavin-dependent oxidoreductase n=1 Tax=Kribbella sp. VKM Ac-2566 TaxID=2512218 RepID=UPI00106416E0|nr:LLM class flavin-dependent oxidoreductase [Kribbella sp. VKM Ac-2566]TDW83705.1 luciferase family oxidoreductase group 1 [Kribbella sp. VKM Ac-2566]